MKFRINLATQPYENARRFFLLWGIVLVAVGLFSAALVYGAVSGWRNAHGIRSKIAAERQTLEKLSEQEKQDLAILNRPENKDVHERSSAINAVIHRKQFSWTRIFADLESLMPGRLHVVSLTPQVTESNEIELRLQVAGDARDKAIELVQRMEKSPEFRHAQIVAETNAETKTGASDTVQFEISALYVPVEAPAAEGGQ